MTTLRATYRLQLNKDFPFSRAAALVPYLDQLGISHAYLSPILMARAGSTHGYDCVDHTRINPELGTIDDFRSLAGKFRAAGIGVILDFVPNHMGVGGADNWLWLDVLKHGKASRYADWFDIDWTPPRPDLDGKLMLPFLGASCAESLDQGDIALRHDADGFAVWAYGTEKYPIRPEDDAHLLATHATPDAAIAATTGHALEGLIDKQNWLLMHFSAAADEINYRRFFINSDLAGIRIDRPDVFAHAHELIFQLVDEGLVDGLRIDHVDGLLDPKAYLDRLAEKLPRPIPVFIEKILAPHERLRPDWATAGTTGYEIGAQLTRLLVPAAAEAALDAIYEDFAGAVGAPPVLARAGKLRVMANELAAELAALARQLAKLAWSHGQTRDLTQNGLAKAVAAVIAELSVYRTYGDETGFAPRDRRELLLALGKARAAEPHYAPALFDFLQKLFCGALGKDYDPRQIDLVIGKFQQYSGPVMAKGLEDTALYRHHRLVALNEVGAHPERFSLSVAAFHDANQRRLAEHPDCLLGTSTHDTKRGEDVRAIVSAIAEHPDDWREAVLGWRDALDGADGIHPNDLYLFFQLLAGGWPAFGPADGFADRIKGAMEKSLREARERSDWGVNNVAYEKRVADFIDVTLADAGFVAQFQRDREPFLRTGLRKGLAQVALKLTVPGVPDIYRGAEDWEQSFVDPDNRRPVDFDALAVRLAQPEAGRDDKLVLTAALLGLRENKPELFARGFYEPVAAEPGQIAFTRRLGDEVVLVQVDLTGRGSVKPEQGWLDALDGFGTDAAFVGYRGF